LEERNRMDNAAAQRQKEGPAQPLLIAFCVVAKIAIFLISASRYGFMSDELYFLDASTHPALGYADFPPLIAWLCGLIRMTLGESLWAIRFAATLIGVCTTLVAIDLCRAMGGGRVAQWLAGLAVLFAPGVLSVQTLLTMNVLDQLWWLLAFRLLFAYLTQGRPAAMWWLGAVLGAGIMTKFSILALCAGMSGAIIIWRRELLQRREVQGAVAIALFCALPVFFWQQRHGFPMFNFLQSYNASEPIAIVLQHPLIGLLITMNPLYAMLWAPGAICIFIREPTSLRILGTVAWLSLGFLMLAGTKFYFAVPTMMLFMIFGAVWWEKLLGDNIRPLTLAAIGLLFVSGFVTLPFASPMLPIATLQKWANQLRDLEAGAKLPEDAPLERYFPHFAEMHGWPELVELTAEIYEGMDPEDRADAVIVAAHYGQAASLNRLDHLDRLPVVHSGHMSYQLWNQDLAYGHGLFIGFSEQSLRGMFAVVEQRGTLDCQYCMLREQNLKIFFVAEPQLAVAGIRERIRRDDFF
jgi:hypothetical protein